MQFTLLIKAGVWMDKKKYNNIISNIEQDSIAEEMGIEKGDILVSINGKKILDVLDYLFLISDDYLEVEIEKKDGEVWVLEIDKDYDEDLGIEFENPILDKAKFCKNKCIFCFVDQLPKNMRKSLYFKDDDSRLSFLQGNFVTLTNLSDADIDRIIEYNISPINVSIHTTNPELRVKMLNNKNAGNVLERIKKLTENRIIINGQIVLCPGVNDGIELDRTIEDLYGLYPNICSMAIVPVGVTKFRENLYPMEIFDKEKATKVINQIDNWHRLLKRKIGTNFVHLSDEFYVLAEKALPHYEDYEGFPQIENGVGLIKKMEYEFDQYLKELPDNLEVDKTITIVTGVSASKFIKELASKLTHKIAKLKLQVVPIINEFFGETITVSGLITGQDIIKQLQNREVGDRLVIPKSMLKSDEPIFLDDVTVEDIEKTFNKDVVICGIEGKSFIESIILK
jgi:putative radical SAM enzyme (TIGR03279 family)